jgi:hypothetical protein
MSKWINKDLFDDFRKEKIEEKDTSSSGFRRAEILWETPEKGTLEQAKVYEGRFLPDPKTQAKFYKRYHYHFWQSGDNWVFILCPKTFSWDNYCPVCSAVVKLYNGTSSDKKQAYNLKRKEKFVSNFFIAKDPRDGDRDEEKKVVGKVKLYEFPLAIEKKLKAEITDKDEGYGHEIFDPSEEGRNFIVKVLSTKKQEDGRTWPDYSSSTFSRSQSPIADTEEEIDAIMGTRIDLDDYLKSMEVAKDKVVEILKNEFVWELIADECPKYGYKDNGQKVEKKEEKKEEVKEEKVDEDAPPWETEAKEEKKSTKKEEVKKDNFNDADLLAELDNM